MAHWTFDETNSTTLGDASGNDVNGTLNGFSLVSDAHWVDGRVGDALRFDGVDDYVSFPGATALDDLHPMTFAGWVMREDLNGGGYILAKRSESTGYWRLHSGNANLTWVRQFTGDNPTYTGGGAPVLNQWTHVAFTWNGEGAPDASDHATHLYVNGDQVANPTRTNGSGSPVPDAPNLFTIGNRPQGNTSYFKGSLDDYRLWDRVLSPAEIETLYQSASSPSVELNATLSGTVNYVGPVPGPVVVWAKRNDVIVNQITLPNGPGAYSMQLPTGHAYDVKAFRDGNGNGQLDAQWQVGEPYAHHGDWNNSTNSFNTVHLDGNLTNVDVNISGHGDNDGDGFGDWEEYAAGSNGDDNESTPDFPGLNYKLVAYYPFDGNASDASGNDLNGTLLGYDANSTIWVAGRLEGALNFDGVNDSVRLGQGPIPDDVRPLTISAWVKRRGYGYVISKRSTSTGYWRFGIEQNQFGWFRDYAGSNHLSAQANTFTANEWRLLTLTWNGGAEGSGTSLYLDAQDVTTSRGNASGAFLSDAANVMHIGSRNGQETFFDGLIDDLRIWNRSLSATEVAELYAMAPPVGAKITDNNFTTAVNLWFSDEATATATYGHIRDWDVSAVTNMYQAFKDRATFNEDITGWDVGNVTNMYSMFNNAAAFNEDIGGWNTFSVTNMGSMFEGAAAFNQPIGDWNVSAVTNMWSMFSGATSFNQDIGNWNTSKVTNMWRLFHNGTSFNQDISDWNTSSLIISAAIFSGASAFNQDIGNWDMSKVTNMNAMFSGASHFDKDIGDWNVSAVNSMGYLFNGATAFNQDISNWNVSADTNMTVMFQNTPALSNANKGLIHSSFSTNSNWLAAGYDWSAFVPGPVFADANVTLTTPENNATAIFVVTATDPDANTTLVYSASGPDAGKFDLNASTGTLTFINPPDFEANASAAGNNAYSLTITATDGEANATQAIIVNITNIVEDFDGDGIEDHFDSDDDDDGFSDTAETAYGSDPRNANSVANQAPTALDLNNTIVAENQPAGTIVGMLTGVDPDGNSTLAFSRANGQGSKHNNQFFVGPHNNLKAKAPIDFEANATLTVRLKVTDEHNASIEQTFVITVLDDPADNNTSVVDDNGTFVDTNATVPDGNGTFVDTNATSPDNNGTLPDSNATVPNPNATLPDGNATIPDSNGTVSEPNEPHPDQNGTFVDTNATLPDDNATVTDSNVTVPDPNTTPPDQNETMVEPHEPHTDGNGTVPDQNGTFVDHNQTHVDTNDTHIDDNATVTDSNLTVPDPNPTHPDQNETMVEPHEPHTDGNGTVPDQNGTHADHNQTYVDTNDTIPDANTTVPDDNATIPDANETIAPPAAPTYRPIARTLRAETDAAGRLTLSGVVLTDGGATVTEVGFILSNSLFAGPDSPGAIIVGGTLSGDVFTASAAMPDLGKRFYYRAYATNAKGTNFGSPKRFVVPEPAVPPAWWASTEEATAGWRVSSWFGAFRPYENGWIFHADLGWLYVQPDGVDGLWVWSEGKGWLWTNPGSYRYLYQAATHRWLYFLKLKDGQPRFYNHATNTVE